MFKGKNIILGVTSSIAAYKSANVASALVKKGCNVNVLMTENATNFINPLTFEELTKHKCIIDTFDRNVQYNVAHISLAVSADAFIIAPASANVIGKIANGIADDMKPHIFEMFYSGKNTVADSRRSFGIGLTLCKSIVELHGGTLTLTDNVPHGCIFTFTLPLSEVTLNE